MAVWTRLAVPRQTLAHITPDVALRDCQVPNQAGRAWRGKAQRHPPWPLTKCGGQGGALPGAGGRTRPLLGTRARGRLFEPAPPPPRGSAPSRSLSSLSKQGCGPRAHVVSEEVVPLGPWRREQPPDVAWRRADGGRPHSAQTDRGPPPQAPLLRRLSACTSSGPLGVFM